MLDLFGKVREDLLVSATLNGDIQAASTGVKGALVIQHHRLHLHHLTGSNHHCPGAPQPGRQPSNRYGSERHPPAAPEPDHDAPGGAILGLDRDHPDGAVCAGSGGRAIGHPGERLLGGEQAGAGLINGLGGDEPANQHLLSTGGFHLGLLAGEESHDQRA